jgi:hypothetical protein
MHELAHEFTSRKVSPWGGIKYFHKTYLKTGLQSYLRGLNLPFPGSNRGYDPVDLIEGFMTSVVLGSRRLEHSGMLRTDEVIKEIFGWEKGMASASTFSRFFQKFSVERNDEVFPEVMKYWFEQIHLPRMTVDIDSTVITRYGNQKEAKKGYNPQKQGRVSHHPLFAFCDDLKMVINTWMRSGDSNSSSSIGSFLEELFYIVPKKRIGLIRADSGFYSDGVFNQLEQKRVGYIVRAKMTSRLEDQLIKIKHWHANNKVRKGACYAEINYKAQGWEEARRMIIVRTEKQEEVDAEDYLFEEEANRSRYDYKAYVTNTISSAVQIHSLYNSRADCENRIKELKYDYSIDGFSLHEFGAMEAAFRMIMIAYNVMSLFRQKVMTSSQAKRLQTIKFQCIAIGSYLVKSGRNMKLKLAAEGKRRHFLEHFFSNLEVLDSPFQFSNA